MFGALGACRSEAPAPSPAASAAGAPASAVPEVRGEGAFREEVRISDCAYREVQDRVARGMRPEGPVLDCQVDYAGRGQMHFLSWKAHDAGGTVIDEGLTGGGLPWKPGMRRRVYLDLRPETANRVVRIELSPN